MYFGFTPGYTERKIMPDQQARGSKGPDVGRPFEALLRMGKTLLSAAAKAKALLHARRHTPAVNGLTGTVAVTAKHCRPGRSCTRETFIWYDV